MQNDAPKHESGKPQKAARAGNFGDRLTLLDKRLAYYVSQRGGNSFYARVANQCGIVLEPGLGTAGVVLDKDGKRHAFLYDDAYIQSLNKENFYCTLVHEMVHVVCMHIPRFMRVLLKAPDGKVRKAIKSVFNIAADMEANDTYVRLEPQFQKTLDDGEFWHLPEQHGFPVGLSMETYIDLLLKNLPAVVKNLKSMAGSRKEGSTGESVRGDGQSGVRGSGRSRQSNNFKPDDQRSDDEKAEETAQSVSEAADKFENLINELLGLHPELTNDTHPQWMDFVEELAEKDPARLEQLVDIAQKEAAKAVKIAHDATTKLRGTVPGGISQRIQAILQPAEVPWTELMRDWVLGNMGRNFTETTRLPCLSLINVDGIEPFPGQVPEPEVNVTWITDTSGSMSDTAFSKASQEMTHLMQQTKAIRLHHIQVDTVIQNEQVFETGDTEMTAQMRYGYGGTTLAAAFARAVEVDLNLWRPGVEPASEVRRPDLMVVFTDGYVEDMAPVMREYHPGCPTLWLITPNGQAPAAITHIGAPHVVVNITRE